MNQTNLIERVKSTAQFLLGVPLTLVAFFFIGKFLIEARGDIIHAFSHANYALLLLGIGCFVLFYLLKNVVWIGVLKRLGEKNLDVSKSFFLLSFAETKRYIPGNIFSFIARVKAYNQLNITTPTLIKSIVIEQLLLIISSLIVSIPGLVFIYPRLIQTFPQYSAYFLPALIGLIIFTLLIMGAVIVTAKKKLGMKKISIRKLITEYAPLVILSVVSWFFFGIGSYLIATSIYFFDPRLLYSFASLFILTWFIGYISIITPMGLGVREGVMILGLSPFAPTSIAVLIALFSRVCFMAAEFLFLGLSYILYASKKVQKLFNRAQNYLYEIIISLSALFYAAYFSYVSIIKHNNFFTGRFDLGNMDQTVWNTLHGKIFLFTNPDSTEIISRLAFHADFILVLLAPFYLLWSDPRMLLILQSIVLAAGAFVVYYLSTTIIKDKNISLFLAIGYLLNPIIQRQNLYDFHAVTFATTFLLATWLFMVKKRYILMVIFLLLSVLTKENIYLPAALIGGYLIIKRQFKWGIPIATLSIVVFLLLMKKFIPDARGGHHFALAYLYDFGTTTTEVAKNIILNPVKTVSVFFQNNGLQYLHKLLLPVGYLPIAAPLYLLFSVPDILKNILSSNPNLRNLAYQYNAEIVPFIFISTIYAVAFLAKKIPVKILSTYIIITSLIGAYFYGALPGGKQGYTDIYTKPRSYAAEIRTYIQTIEPNARVAATNNLGAHLSQRDHIYVLPNGIEQSDYILFLIAEWYDQHDKLRQMVEELKLNPQYELVYTTNNNFFAFKKVKSYSRTIRYSVGK